MKIKVVLMCICFCFLTITSIKSQIFSEINTALPAITNIPLMDWGDYNNDGYDDLLIAGQLDTAGLPAFCYILTYDGTSFNIIDLNITHSSTPFVKWIDYDNDGDLDFLYSGHTGTADKTFIYENNAGVFTEKDLSINYSGYIAIGDLNNNGYQDFVLVSRWSSQPFSGVFINDSAGFYLMTSTLLPLKNASVAIADYNNDGKNDILISGETFNIADYRVNLYKNNGNAVFTEVSANFENIRGYVSFGDYNNDTLLDILISGIYNYNNPIVKLYKNEGNDGFSDSLNLLAISGKSVFFDFNNDNALDILIAGNTGVYPNTTTVLRILENNNQGAFTLLNPQLFNHYGELAVGDFNNDGYPDFAISGPNQLNDGVYSTRIYENNLKTFIKKNINDVAPKIFPNPATDYCYIYASNGIEKFNIIIFDIRGRHIAVPYHFTENAFEIDLRNLKSGFYFIRIKEDDKTTVHKLIKN